MRANDDRDGVRARDMNLENMRHNYETTVLLEGMNCNQTEALATQALKSIPKVKDVKASHRENQAVITSTRLLEEEEIKEALEKYGFRVMNIY